MFTFNTTKNLYISKFKIIDTDNLSEQSFRVNKVYINDDECRIIKPTIIKFKRKINIITELDDSTSFSMSNCCYEFNLYKDTIKGVIPFKSEQKLYAEVVSTSDNGMITLYLEDECGDGVGYCDRGFIEENYDENNIPIDYLVIDTEEEHIE